MRRIHEQEARAFVANVGAVALAFVVPALSLAICFVLGLYYHRADQLI